MSGLFFLLSTIYDVWAIVEFFKKPKPEYQQTSFTAALKRGDVTVIVGYHAATENPTAPSLERIIRRWAITTEDAALSRELYDVLESELQRNFPQLDPKVISMAISGIEAPPPPPPPKPSRAERMASRQKEKRDCAEALAKDAGIDLDQDGIAGRPYRDRVRKDAESTINDLFHHPDYHA